MPNKILRKISVPLILIIWACSPFLAKAGVYINEVAWMGTTNSANDEWIEIYNDGSESIDLNGWTLSAVDGAPNINFSSTTNKIIPAGGFYLLERTDDSAVLGITADLIYTGALSNDGENLVLKNKDGSEIDRINGSNGWPAGDNISKQTMQKISSGWVAAIGTPKASNVGQASSQSSSASSQESFFANSSSSQNYSSVSSVANYGGGSVSWPDEQQIYANAGKDKTGIAGADVLFEGKALGFKKEPLENARYLWTLGDGSYKEGKNIRHIYKYPSYSSNYIVVLEVLSGGISAADRVNIKVIPNELQIVETKNEFIKLKNKSSIILDVSSWFLRAGGVVFKFPNHSLISANSELIISSDVSGLKFADNKFSAEILYPNGSVAFSYSPSPASSSSSKSKETVLSKPPEKNINTAVALASPVVSQKNSSAPTPEEVGAPTKASGAEKNLASVITIGEKNNSSAKIWLILAVFTGIIGGTGVFLARRNVEVDK